MTKQKLGLVQNRYKRELKSDGRLRVVGVSFLNAQPHLHGLLSGLGEERMQVALAEPSELARRLYEDEADIGLCPVVPLATHGGFELVPGVAIGCDGAVRSIRIVGDVPIEEADEILLDAASRTSQILARLIVRHLRRGSAREPRFFSRPAREIMETVSGKTLGLLIGDAALAIEGTYKYELDLGQAWKDMTGLPFVFAVWAARPGVLTAADCELLQRSLALGLEARPAIAQGWLHSHGGDLAAHLGYLNHSIRYALDESAQAGLREFLRRAAEAKLLPDAELRFFGETTPATGSGAVHQQRRSIDALLEYAADGGRLSVEDALWLGRDANTHELGLAADMRRKALHPDEVVTYIVDRNVNYTNVCTTSCRFCAFYRPVGHAEGYVLTR
ncbi:MAG: hypothetical protein RL701_2765, partial [Pseudomonadota bacterium]